MYSWGKIELDAVTDTGDLTQLYPNWVTPGAAWPGTAGQEIRKPTGGRLASIQIQTDNTYGGSVEVWDVCGLDLGVDVSSNNVITDAELQTLIGLGKAKLIWSMNFTSTSGASTPAAFPSQSFMRGLAARFIQDGPLGSCYLTLIVEGGYYKTNSAGA